MPKTIRKSSAKPKIRRKDPVFVQPKAGAPTKLTPKLQDKLLKMARAGVDKATAADCCEISKVTLYGWINKGANAEQKILDADEKGDKCWLTPQEAAYLEFFNLYRKAEAESELADWLSIGNSAAAGDWRAAAWRLERKNPKRYGKQVLFGGADGAGGLSISINYGDEEGDAGAENEEGAGADA